VLVDRLAASPPSTAVAADTKVKRLARSIERQLRELNRLL
jgi:hypothetical protein